MILWGVAAVAAVVPLALALIAINWMVGWLDYFQERDRAMGRQWPQGVSLWRRVRNEKRRLKWAERNRDR